VVRTILGKSCNQYLQDRPAQWVNLLGTRSKAVISGAGFNRHLGMCPTAFTISQAALAKAGLFAQFEMLV